MEHAMKYPNTHEFTSQIKLATPCSKSRKSFREAIKLGFKSLFAPRFDPTRLTRVERLEMGVTERHIDWHNALHGPLVK